MVDGARNSMPAGTPKSGGAGVIVIVLLLLGAAGGVLWYVTRKPAETPKTPVVATSASASTPAPAPTIDLPALPTVDDAGPETPDDAGADAAKKLASGPPVNNCPATCSGEPGGNISAQLNAKGATAKQCYKTAIEGNEGLSGDIVFQVRIGLDGSVCSVNTLSNSTGSNKLEQCARSRLMGSYAAPKGGCVDVKVPLNFKPKT